MAAKRRGLDRGLDELLGDAGYDGLDDRGELKSLPVEFLVRGRYQPRTEFDPAALQELADSIKAQGVVQPIVVRPLSEDRYEIVAGERRWRAAQLAGLAEIPALVRDIPDEAAVAVALIENIQREDLNPLEEAAALHRLTDEFGMTHQRVADAVGRSRASVSNLLRLLELAPEVKRLVAERRLEMGHARALAALPQPEQARAALQVAERGLTVRATEALVRKLLEGETAPRPKAVDPDLRRLQDELGERLGAAVKIQHNAKGRGKLVIEYTSLDELDGILEHIQ
ncbi:ParB/RepB/Spo0J family partition protein [Alkalilimnicola sp. S0819]|uniref:ParB/RepB/Spo0J family partition protein n=1 Tax=Alkalilimnicola sp. S0819 TaxID=2613922 RepID=UPI001261C891|nr:ParB/RepB/Spo0J family partition protein [Alkalilimnicola sp. S0819]KAB7624222.1 ParB/RepB/Spo0J family partition protein [Alkalilimnicola sp. S0819]MPQ16477.1 ParB/RepB/Spo0J family partition protein [Alkalilimnicola sp. S0819]